MARGLPEHKSVKEVTLSSWDQEGHGPEGAVHPGEEKGPGRPQHLPAPKGDLQETWRGTLEKGLE